MQFLAPESIYAASCLRTESIYATVFPESICAASCPRIHIRNCLAQNVSVQLVAPEPICAFVASESIGAANCLERPRNKVPQNPSVQLFTTLSVSAASCPRIHLCSCLPWNPSVQLVALLYILSVPLVAPESIFATLLPQNPSVQLVAPESIFSTV